MCEKNQDWKIEWDWDNYLDNHISLANSWGNLSDIPSTFVNLRYLYCDNDHVWFTRKENMERVLFCQMLAREFLERLSEKKSRQRTRERLAIIEEELLSVSMRPDRIKNTGLCVWEKWE